VHVAFILEFRVLLVDLPEELLNSYILALLLGCAHECGVLLEIDVDNLVRDWSLFGGRLLLVVGCQYRVSLLTG